jgi:phosphatidylglycerophosphate synthase
MVDRIGLALPLPNINPNVISGFSIITSLMFLLSMRFSVFLSLLFLAVTLLLDWFDGLISRKLGLVSEDGYLVDLASDRFSEGIIFVAFFFPWFYLFLANCILSIIAVTRRRHLMLPLRHVFLIFYAFLLFLGAT